MAKPHQVGNPLELAQRSRRLGLSPLALWLLLLSAAFAQSGPTDLHPEAPLDARPDDAAGQALIAEADDLSRAAWAQLDQFRPRAANVNPQEIGNAWVQMLHLVRLADQLKLMGEPAGHDYAIRAAELKLALEAVIKKVAENPDFSNDFAVKALKKIKQAGTRQLPRIKKQADVGQFEAAERALNAILDDLHRYVIWMTADGAREYLQPFAQVAGQVHDGLATLRKERSLQQLADERNRRMPDLARLSQQVVEATNLLAEEDQATFLDGVSVTGPQLVVALGEEWKRMQLDAVACSAIDWSRGAVLGSPQTAERAQLTAAHTAFVKKSIEQVGKMITAQAGRASASAAPVLHQEYVRALAPLAPLFPQNMIAKMATPGLDALAARSPQFAKQVADYRTATHDHLVWQRRATSARVKALEADYPTLSAAITGVVRSQAGKNLLLPENGSSIEAAALWGSAPAVMTHAGPALVGRQVTVSDLVGLPPTPGQAVSRYFDRSIAHLKLADAERLAAAIAGVEAQFWAADPAGPLTLEAAIPVESARRGDLAAVGGEIKSLRLEPIITAFLLTGDRDWAQVRLGPLPEEPAEMDLSRHVLLRCTIEPRWLQHECFFIDLAAKEKTNRKNAKRDERKD